MVYLPGNLTYDDFVKGEVYISKVPLKSCMQEGFACEGNENRMKYKEHLIVGRYEGDFLSKKVSTLDGNFFKANFNTDLFERLSLTEYCRIKYSTYSPYLGYIEHLRFNPNLLAFLIEVGKDLSLNSFKDTKFPPILESLPSKLQLGWRDFLGKGDLSAISHIATWNPITNTWIMKQREDIIPETLHGFTYTKVQTPDTENLKSNIDVENHTPIALAKYVSTTVHKSRGKKKTPIQVLSK